MWWIWKCSAGMLLILQLFKLTTCFNVSLCKYYVLKLNCLWELSRQKTKLCKKLQKLKLWSDFFCFIWAFVEILLMFKKLWFTLNPQICSLLLKITNFLSKNTFLFKMIKLCKISVILICIYILRLMKVLVIIYLILL